MTLLTAMLQHLEAVPLPMDGKLAKLTGRPGETRVLLYDKLVNKPFHKILNRNKPCAIVLLQRHDGNQVGHFIAIWLQGDTLHIFDPYGMQFSELMKITNSKPHLIIAAKQAGKQISQNHFPIQKLAEGENTCARHACTRLRFKNMSDEEYNKFINGVKGLSPDQTVTLMTAFAYKGESPYGYTGEDFKKDVGAGLMNLGVYHNFDL